MRVIAAVFAAWMIGLVFGIARAEEMPPLPEASKAVYESYRLEFLPDGYPGKRTEHGVVPHPIYGPYVIRDYVTLFRRTGERRYLDAAEKVAGAAIKRMDQIGDALVFYYTPESGLTKLAHKFYSGLTQSRYLGPLMDLYDLTEKEEYSRAAAAVAASFTIPVEDGGVVEQSPFGPTIEEYPQEVPSYVLNGWMTAVLSLYRYGKRAGSQKATRMADENLTTMIRLLPLYDYPALKNSRYQLSGSLLQRLVLKKRNACRLDGFKVKIGERIFQDREPGNRWRNYISPEHIAEDGYASGKVLQFHTMLNRITYPKKNALQLQVICRKETKAAWKIAAGDYNPFRTSIQAKRWETITELDLRAGTNDVHLDMPWEKVPLIGYPTNFNRKIAGDKYNAYHYIHVAGLKKLFDLTERPELRDWYDKWRAYIHDWPSVEAYKRDGIRLDCYAARSGGACVAE